MKYAGAIMKSGIPMDKNQKLKEWRARNPDRVKDHLQSYYQKNKEKLRAATAAYRLKNLEKLREYNRTRLANRTPEQKAKDSEKKREASLRRRYGISVQDYLLLLDKQNGTCALCSSTPEKERYKRLNVDHCHHTGKVRGLLCTQCNHALGVLGDTAESLNRAMKYLEGSNA